MTMKTRHSLIAVCFLVALAFLVVHLWTSGSPSGSVTQGSQVEAKSAVPAVQALDPKKCAEAMREARRADLIRHYEYSGGLATVVVGDGYAVSDFAVKNGVNVAVRCAITEGRMDTATLHFILYQDPRGHRQVATWDDASGLEIE
jgi:hypothetical protein